MFLISVDEVSEFGEWAPSHESSGRYLLGPERSPKAPGMLSLFLPELLSQYIKICAVIWKTEIVSIFQFWCRLKVWHSLHIYLPCLKKTCDQFLLRSRITLKKGWWQNLVTSACLAHAKTWVPPPSLQTYKSVFGNRHLKQLVLRECQERQMNPGLTKCSLLGRLRDLSMSWAA